MSKSNYEQNDIVRQQRELAQEKEGSEEGQPKDTRQRTKERVQLDFAPEALERLDALKNDTGASTRAEIIRQALRLFEWFVYDVNPNDTITITDERGLITATFRARLLHNAAKPN